MLAGFFVRSSRLLLSTIILAVTKRNSTVELASWHQRWALNIDMGNPWSITLQLSNSRIPTINSTAAVCVCLAKNTRSIFEFQVSSQYNTFEYTAAGTASPYLTSSLITKIARERTVRGLVNSIVGGTGKGIA